MEINGTTRICGVIGNPVEHTLSPLIHNSLSASTGINLAYAPFHVETGNLEDAIKGAWALNLLGLNITVPYKSDVIPYLSEIDEMAEKIGAVNTLVRSEKGYKGYNTDMPGLFRAMQSDGVNVRGEKVLVLGAGGVARAVVMMLASKGAKEIFIFNRSLDHASAIADEVNAYEGKQIVKAMTLEGYRDLPADEKFLAIQATSVGMFPKVDEVVIADRNFYKRVHTGYDLIFNPANTKFMQLVQAEGGKAYNGLKMLLYQGIIAYELWTKRVIPEHLAGQVYKKMLQEMKDR